MAMVNRLVKYDNETTTDSYVGVAPMGSSDADPVWRIMWLHEEPNNQEELKEVRNKAWDARRTTAFEDEPVDCPTALDGGDSDELYTSYMLDGGSSTSTYAGCALDGGSA